MREELRKCARKPGTALLTRILEHSHTCLVTAISHLFSDDREILEFSSNVG
jgi:hypothetical protein